MASVFVVSEGTGHIQPPGGALSTGGWMCPLLQGALSDDFSDLENVHFITDDDEIHQNDFVLVKFSLKMSVSYYVGKVIESLNLNEFQIKYLRRKVPGYKFYYPLVDDISTVDRSDLVLKLPDS